MEKREMEIGEFWKLTRENKVAVISIGLIIFGLGMMIISLIIGLSL